MKLTSKSDGAGTDVLVNAIRTSGSIQTRSRGAFIDVDLRIKSICKRFIITSKRPKRTNYGILHERCYGRKRDSYVSEKDSVKRIRYTEVRSCFFV